MDLICDNCGQTAVANDTHCWQCGWPLPAQPAVAAPARPEARRGPVAMLTVYGGLTIFIVLITLGLFALLGRRPTVQATQWRARENFTFVSDLSRTFIVELPEEWPRWDKGDRRQAAAFQTQIAGHPQLAAALLPWSRIAPDMEIIFAAASEPVMPGAVPQNFLLVVRSTELNALSAAAATNWVARSDVLVMEQEFVENFDKSHLYFSLVVPQLAPSDRCQEQLIPGQREAMLVVVCTPAFSAERRAVPVILDSFQSFLD